jgi:hypothetical protein
VDKLEFDSRLAHLERRVGLLTALLLGLLALVGVGLMFLGASARATPTAIISPPPPSMATVMEMPLQTHAVTPGPSLDMMDEGVGHLVARLEELAQVKGRGLITEEEFQSKKDEMIAKPLHSTALAPELEKLNDMLAQGVISEAELQTLKAKILAAVQ